MTYQEVLKVIEDRYSSSLMRKSNLDVRVICLNHKHVHIFNLYITDTNIAVYSHNSHLDDITILELHDILNWWDSTQVIECTFDERYINGYYHSINPDRFLGRVENRQKELSVEDFIVFKRTTNSILFDWLGKECKIVEDSAGVAGYFYFSGYTLFHCLYFDEDYLIEFLLNPKYIREWKLKQFTSSDC
jgi:hypothetical protein